MIITLRNYQEPVYNNIIDTVKNYKKIAVAMPTGSGKSVVIGKLANDISKLGRTLILTHRAEILQQNSEWLTNYGMLTSKIDNVRNSHNIVIAMVQTLDARLKKYGINYIGQFDNIIVDEAHVQIYEKVYSKYNYNLLVGFTGTPVLDKRITKTIDGIKYARKLAFEDLYDILIQGPDSQELIDLGYLIQDYNIVLQQPNLDNLVESKQNPDGYTSNSLSKVYTHTASIDVLWKAYQEYGIGKKTIIFNPTTRVNTYVYDFFKSKNINVKVYDSVKSGDRNEILEWFNNNRDAVLINANVFTTGFNVPDVEVVVVNRKTKSLSLWIQMVGRGSRTTTKIYKDMFTVIDLGDNIHEHGIWSKHRDWNDYFYKQPWKPVRTVDLLTTWDCPVCQAINTYNDLTCVNCDFELADLDTSKDIKDLKTRSGELVVIGEMPLPRAKTIIKYTEQVNGNMAFALNLLENKIVNLFIHYNVSKEYYDARRAEFNKRVRDIFIPIYFAIVKSDLQGKYLKLETRLNKLIDKIKQLY